MDGTLAASGLQNVPTRVLLAPAPNTTSFEVDLCLPTAPALPIEGSEDFGTSPLYGQLSDKPLLALALTHLGMPDAKHNSGSRI